MTNQTVNKIVLRNEKRFRCGTTTFGCRAGAVVLIRQRDEVYGKVLLDFGNGLIDWFNESILEKFDELVD